MSLADHPLHTRNIRKLYRGDQSDNPSRCATPCATPWHTTSSNSTAPPPNDLYQMVMQQVEQPLFESVMAYTGGNQSKAATLLGISRSTLRKKLALYEIE